MRVKYTFMPLRLGEQQQFHQPISIKNSSCFCSQNFQICPHKLPLKNKPILTNIHWCKMCDNWPRFPITSYNKTNYMIHVITLPDLEYVINKLNSENNESFIQSKYPLFLQIYNQSRPIAYFFGFVHGFIKGLSFKCCLSVGTLSFACLMEQFWL